jgi:hypothetical protein
MWLQVVGDKCSSVARSSLAFISPRSWPSYDNAADDIPLFSVLRQKDDYIDILTALSEHKLDIETAQSLVDVLFNDEEALVTDQILYPSIEPRSPILVSYDLVEPPQQLLLAPRATIPLTNNWNNCYVNVLFNALFLYSNAHDCMLFEPAIPRVIPYAAMPNASWELSFALAEQLRIRLMQLVQLMRTPWSDTSVSSEQDLFSQQLVQEIYAIARAFNPDLPSLAEDGDPREFYDTLVGLIGIGGNASICRLTISWDADSGEQSQFMEPYVDHCTTIQVSAMHHGEEFSVMLGRAFESLEEMESMVFNLQSKTYILTPPQSLIVVVVPSMRGIRHQFVNALHVDMTPFLYETWAGRSIEDHSTTFSQEMHSNMIYSLRSVVFASDDVHTHFNAAVRWADNERSRWIHVDSRPPSEDGRHFKTASESQIEAYLHRAYLLFYEHIDLSEHRNEEQPDALVDDRQNQKWYTGIWNEKVQPHARDHNWVQTLADLLESTLVGRRRVQTFSSSSISR